MSPIPLIAMNYGGEIHFRVYLFMLPMLAFLAAALFFGRESASNALIARIALTFFLFAGSVGFLLANNGKDKYYYFTPNEVAASEWLYTNGVAGSLLVEGARSYPSQFKNYERFSYLPISEESINDRRDLIARPPEIMLRWLSNPAWKGGYIIITRSQKVYTDAEGFFGPGMLDGVEKALLASPYFKVIYANRDAKIFTLNR
jgi:hypothetical protein